MTNTNLGKHLGQKSEYVKYYDKSLLVREPRQTNREIYGLKEDKLPFVGFDVWNAYEVSALTNGGQPVVAIAKIVYPCTNKYIVESKSLKLYLNSYNMTKLGKNNKEVRDELRNRIERDLSSLLETEVDVTVYDPTQNHIEGTDWRKEYPTIENVVNLNCNIYNETPSLIKTEIAQGIQIQMLHSALLKSNCKVTGAPDFSDVYIFSRGEILFDMASVLKYIISYRDEAHLHEEVCEGIFTRLHEAAPNNELMVACLYTRRGGIDINPCRATSSGIIPYELDFTTNIYKKTARQ